MAKFKRARIKDLCPTQLTVGMFEVEVKRNRLMRMSAKLREAFLQAHPMPVVIGPEGKLYITDHHHLARAAMDAKIDEACFEVEADLSSRRAEKFWLEMDKKSWVHPLDQHGIRHRYDHIPSRLDQLVDDVYRSLAGFVRDAGGFKKTNAAFVEFVWADYFRRNIAIEDVKADFLRAVGHAKRLARGPGARLIPGFTG